MLYLSFLFSFGLIALSVKLSVNLNCQRCAISFGAEEETKIELSPRISGKCQLILMPGETRDLKLAGVEIRDAGDLAVEFFTEGAVVPVPVEGFYPEKKSTSIAISVPADIDISRTWSGRVRLGEDVFCEFEVKFLDAEVAKSLGWENA